MGRRIRYVPEGLVEITVRCFQGCYLLLPSGELNDRFLGVVGRARELFPVQLHVVSVMSNHYHLLMSPGDAEQQANFMGHLNGNLSKEIGRLHDWRGTMFERRFSSIAVSEEPYAQIQRLEYLLEQGCKEGLVARPSDWPGINSSQSIIEGKPLKGTWYDRSKEFAARNSGKKFHAKEFATEYEIVLDPLPCWAHLETAEYQRRVQEVVDRIEERTAKRHLTQGTVPLGAAEVLKRHPHQRPNRVKWSPAPLIHAASKKVRWEFFNAYQAVFAAYHEAAEKFREGQRNALFPEGCFPPRLPFVRPIRLNLSG